jgi:hypothetical protein
MHRTTYFIIKGDKKIIYNNKYCKYRKIQNVIRLKNAQRVTLF